MLGRLILLAMILTHALAREPQQVCVAVCAPAASARGSDVVSAPLETDARSCGAMSREANCCAVGSTGAVANSVADADTEDESCCAAPAATCAASALATCSGSAFATCGGSTPATCGSSAAAACCGEPAASGVEAEPGAQPKSPCLVCSCAVDCCPEGAPPPAIPLPVVPERDSLVSVLTLSNVVLAEVSAGGEQIHAPQPAATPRFRSHHQRQSLLATWLN